jgi:hypothetical protein
MQEVQEVINRHANPTFSIEDGGGIRALGARFIALCVCCEKVSSTITYADFKKLGARITETAWTCDYDHPYAGGHESILNEKIIGIVDDSREMLDFENANEDGSRTDVSYKQQFADTNNKTYIFELSHEQRGGRFEWIVYVDNQICVGGTD